MSNPIYIPIADKIQNAIRIYLDTEYKMHSVLVTDYEKKIDSLKAHFDKVDYIPEKMNANNNKSKVDELFGLKHKTKRIVSLINKINPDAIILGSDATDVFKVCNTFFAHKKLFVIQQSALRPFVEIKYSTKEKLSYLFYRYILKVPILASNPWYTYKDNATHLLWSDFFCLSAFKKYIATGNPAWDNLISSFEEHKYEYSATRNTICIATQPVQGTEDEQLYNEYIAMIQQCIKHLPEFNFIIKVHPRDNSQRYADIFMNEKVSNVSIVNNESMDSVLDRCFVLVTAWSMTAFESAIKGVPVVFGNPNFGKDLTTINSSNILPVADTAEVLENNIRLLTQKGGYQNFLDIRNNFLIKINTINTPTSAQTIAKIITNAA